MGAGRAQQQRARPACSSGRARAGLLKSSWAARLPGRPPQTPSCAERIRVTPGLRFSLSGAPGQALALRVRDNGVSGHARACVPVHQAAHPLGSSRRQPLCHGLHPRRQQRPARQEGGMWVALKHGRGLAASISRGSARKTPQHSVPMMKSGPHLRRRAARGAMSGSSQVGRGAAGVLAPGRLTGLLRGAAGRAPPPPVKNVQNGSFIRVYTLLYQKSERTTGYGGPVPASW